MKNKLNYRIATPLFLWGLGVSAVIVGEFAGWNEGLKEGGFGGMLVATLIISLMFGCLSATYSELATAMPFSGGTLAYSRAAFNPAVAFVTGIAQVIEYLATLATVLASIQITTQHIFEGYYGIHLPMFGAWVFFALIFALLNIWDSRMFYRSALILSLASLGALTFFFIKALPFFDINLLLNIPFVDGGTKWLPKGIVGVAWCLPFAIWLYVVLEIIALAPEDSENTKEAIPKAFYASFITILIFSLLVLFLVPGVGLGAIDIADRTNSYRIALEFVTEHKLPAFILFALVMSGPLAGYHSTVFAAAKVIFSLGRIGYLPKKLAVMSEKRQTPHIAIVFVSVAVLLILISINEFTDPISSVPILLNMAVLGAIISYAMTFISYIVLSVKHPSMKRPYVSPLGVTGAMAGLIISLFTTLLMFTQPVFVTALGLCVLIMVASLIYFLAFGRSKISPEAPEESFAHHLQKSHSLDGL
jgi:ethanolamine permease